MPARLFQEVTRTVTVSYPVPFMLACLLAFALGCFGVASTLSFGFFAGSILAAGMFAMVAAVFFAGYALLRRPDLLRSERFNLMNRYIDVRGDDRMGTGLDRAMLTYLEEDLSKRAVPTPGHQPRGASRDVDQ